MSSPPIIAGSYSTINHQQNNLSENPFDQIFGKTARDQGGTGYFGHLEPAFAVEIDNGKSHD